MAKQTINDVGAFTQADKDAANANFTELYSGPSGTGVAGPSSATDGDVVAFDGTTGKLIKDGAKLVSDLVTGPASVTTGKPAIFSGTSGKVLAASAGASAGPFTTITGITVVNGIVTALTGS